MGIDDDGLRPGSSPTDFVRRRVSRTLVGVVVANRYRIERLVSAGAYTVVVDAADIQVERPVTLKLIRPEISELPEFQRRFDEVMRSMSTLSHLNISAIHDWGQDRVGGRTTMFAVVEHLGAGSLRDLFDRGRYLSPSQALVIGLDACRALDHAHRRNLVHGELTPSKLVFGDDRRLRVVDFGLARLLGASSWREPAIVETHVARYASPEQALGQPIDEKTDVYALALTLIEAVTGAVPFSGDSTVATLSARIGKLTPVSADLGALASVLERAARPDRGQRWSAAEFGRALVRAAEKLPRPEPLPLVTTPRPEPEAPVADDQPTEPHAVVTTTTEPAVSELESDPEPETERDDAPDPAPAPRRPWLKALTMFTLLVVVLSAVGLVGNLLTRAQRHEVPALAGMAQEEAVSAVEDFDWDVQTRLDRSDDEPDAGDVIRTSPAPGDQLAEGEPLFLFVSEGPELRTLPELRGDRPAAARERLEELRLEASTADRVYDEEIPPGSVVSWAVAGDAAKRAGDEVLPGTEIELTLSRGPEPRSVPDLRTLSVAQATGKLEELRLELELGEPQFSNVIEKDLIIRQRPKPGVEIERGEVVTVRVSKGPDFVVFPELDGLNFRQAVAALERAGYVRGEVLGSTQGKFERARINGVSVDAGEQFVRGTTVDLVFL